MSGQVENAPSAVKTANPHEAESDVLKIKAADWAVQPTSIEAARQIIEQYHYAGGAGNTAVYVHGLFRRGSVELVGVAWWCAAVKGSVDKYNAGGESTTLVLQRLAISPDAPNNAASFLLGRSIRLIKQDARFDYLITYADTYRNHTGQIYRATNWEYRGESDPTPVWIDSSGRQWSRKNGNGGSYTHEQMKARGAALAGYYAKHVYTMALKLHRRPLPQQIPLIETESAVYDATAKRLGYEKVGTGSYRSASHLAQEALTDNGFEPVEDGSAIYRQTAQHGVEYSPAVDSVREAKFQLRQERKAGNG